VLVLNYNGREHLDECLGSLGVQDVFIPGWPGQPRDEAARDEVWLIDNASTDGSVEHVIGRFPWVRVVESDANLGFSRAYNRAAAMCGSEHVVFLNNDTRVGPNFLTSLHRTRAAHAEAKGVAVELDLSPLVEGRGLQRQRVIARYRELLQLHRRYRFPFTLASNARSILAQKSVRDMVLLAGLFGMEEAEVTGALSSLDSILAGRSPVQVVRE